MTKKLKKTGHKYLNVLERVLTLSLLPKEGTFANLKLLRTAKENLSFTDEENKKLNFQEADGMVKWMENSVGDKAIEIGEIATQLIVEALEKLNEEEKITENLMSVYEKFVD